MAPDDPARGVPRLCHRRDHRGRRRVERLHRGRVRDLQPPRPRRQRPGQLHYRGDRAQRLPRDHRGHSRHGCLRDRAERALVAAAVCHRRVEIRAGMTLLPRGDDFAIPPAPPTGGRAEPLISVRALSKSFSGPDGHPVPVLEGVDLSVSEGEFVALLGRSGSGKSTLLRCIAGLIAPTGGEVLFRGKRLTGTNRDTTMVFQTFALLPWLTVQQNVELGLEARGVAPADRSERALRAIDLVGLDGFESAYPKELSGGMRQRVGFARALVVEPAALLMDEPFSALDVLTSENLRGELLELWEGQRFPTKTMIMVTHNIEEAVLLADRLLVLGSNPGRIRADMRNPLPRPRRRRTPEFEELVDQIYRMMTQRDQATAARPVQSGRGPGALGESPLPQAPVDGLSGLAEILLGRHEGAADLADLAANLGLEVDHLLPLVDALGLLGFAGLDGDVLELTPSGRVFAGASIPHR